MENKFHHFVLLETTCGNGYVVELLENGSVKWHSDSEQVKKLCERSSSVASLCLNPGELTLRDVHRHACEASDPFRHACEASDPFSQHCPGRLAQILYDELSELTSGDELSELKGGHLKLGNPFDTGKFFAPTMGQHEQETLIVPFSEIGTKLRATLEEHGVAIVTGVIPTSTELSKLEELFFQDLLGLVDKDALKHESQEVQDVYEKFVSEGPRAFPSKTAAHFTAAAGFSVRRCLSQGKFSWSVRQHPNVQAVYRAIYPDAEHLVGSMDVLFFTPGDGAPAESCAFSAHVDQNIHDVRPGLADLESYQGVVYIWPSNEKGDTSTTVVWPGSHRSIFHEIMRDRSFVFTGNEGFHYSEIKDMSDKRLGRKIAAGWAEHARRAVVPEGGMILWNSRTVHTGWRGGPRLAQTVCFEPASRRTEAERVAKLRLAALGLPSTHWASAGMQHDIVLGDEGYLRMHGTRGKHGKHGIELPLRPAIRPAGLAKDADLDALEDLVKVEYHLTGMWLPTEGSAELLEASVADEYKLLL